VWEGKREGDDIIARPVERGLGGWLMGEPQPVLWW
jgi:hypothetical protein